MTDRTLNRLFDATQAFADPVTTVVTAVLVGILILVPCVYMLLSRKGVIIEPLRGELWRRYFSWLILIPLMLGLILLGAFWTILGFGILSIFCYRE